MEFNSLSVSSATNSMAVTPGSRGIPKTSVGVLVLIGFTAVIAQIVLMRELMVVFYGNEMSLGLMLACWLLWTAIGSSVAGRLAARAKHPRRLVASFEMLLAAALPLAIFLLRASKTVFQAVPGEVLGPGPMLLTSLFVLSAPCIVSGGLFAAGSRLYADEGATSMASGSSHVYVLEAVGSAVGGVLASLILIRACTSFQIAALLSLLNLLAAAALIIRRNFLRATILPAVAVAFAVFVFPFGCRWLEKVSLDRLWTGYHLLATRNSVYGNLAVVETEGSRSLFENGWVAFNAPDPAAAEEAVHFALLQHPWPRSLLLIGGGMNGSLEEALQHPSLERIDYVELDPAVLELARRYFPTEAAPLRADPRVHVHNIDGRLFLKRTDSTFDVVIVNLPEPQTAQLNRFYTLEFFEEAARKLSPTGVFSLEIKGAEDYISPGLAEFLQCIYKTLREVFPEVSFIPGETIHFFAAARPGTLATGSEELIARLRARQIHTNYVREYYLPYRMMPDRMADLGAQLQPQAGTRTNRDFAPIAYYFDVALWSSRFNSGYRRVFQAMAQLRFGGLAASLAIALFALAGCIRLLVARKNQLRTTAGFCIATMGFTQIGLEMLLLLAFQAIYGYVYQQLAIIIAGFMAGMAMGSWMAQRERAVCGAASASARQIRRLFTLQLLAAASPLIVCWLFAALAGIKNPPTVFLASQVLFPFLGLICGFLGGYQFPVATAIFFAGSRDSGSSPGALYALDLAGACLGAMVLSAYLVPVFGFQETAWLMATANLAPAILIGIFAISKKPIAA
jgi:spermidine synthase